MKPTTSLSTANVPPQFLKPAYLVGCIPFKTLATESRVSYTLYIPETWYNPDPTLRNSKDAANIQPAYQLPQLPLVVTIHGTRRNAEQCRDALIPLADSVHVVILAPLFPAGQGGIESLNNYKLLRDDSLHADIALIDILHEIRERWHGIATDKVFMIGFSGGGQFVHRFMYLYPNLLHAVSIGAPGRVTLLDDQQNWPAGIQDVADKFDGAMVDFELIREVPCQLIGGALDTETHGGEAFWKWLRAMKKREKNMDGQSSADNNLIKTTNRMRTLRGLQEHWRQKGIECQLDIVDHAGHERGKIVEVVVEFLRPHLERAAYTLELGY